MKRDEQNHAAAVGWRHRLPEFRVLLVGHLETLKHRLDRNQYYRYEALSRKPGVTLFGPGVPGYWSGMSAQEAVTVACGGVWPEVLIHGMDLKESGVPLLSHLPQANALTVVELMDSWARPERQTAFINGQGFDVGL